MRKTWAELRAKAVHALWVSWLMCVQVFGRSVLMCTNTLVVPMFWTGFERACAHYLGRMYGVRDELYPSSTMLVLNEARKGN